MPGTQKLNALTLVTGPELPSEGASTSLILDVAEITKTGEVKLVIMEANLHWSQNGEVATWSVWVGRFVDLGPSNILPGTGPHAVTVVTTSKGVSFFEDGVYIGRRSRHIGPTIKVSYRMQVATVGTTLRMTASDVYYSGGVASAAVAI